jgi:hypothetical protein
MPSSRRHLPTTIVGALLTFVFVSAAPNPAKGVPGAPAAQDPRTIALQSWHEYLQSIGWPTHLIELHAPRLLGEQKARVANEHGGFTVTFDGSRPGVRATVTVVLDAAGKPVAKPVVQLADVLEAR